MGDVKSRFVEAVASEHTAHTVTDELLYDYIIVPYYMLFVVFFHNYILYELNVHSFTFFLVYDLFLLPP